MVVPRFAAFLLIAATGSLTGCATVVNLRDGYTFELRASDESSPPKKVYGGVIRDVESIRNALEMHSDNGFHELAFKAGAVPVFAADLGLSAIADTLTLPITVPATRKPME